MKLAHAFLYGFVGAAGAICAANLAVRAGIITPLIDRSYTMNIDGMTVSRVRTSMPLIYSGGWSGMALSNFVAEDVGYACADTCAITQVHSNRLPPVLYLREVPPPQPRGKIATTAQTGGVTQMFARMAESPPVPRVEHDPDR